MHKLRWSLEHLSLHFFENHSLLLRFLQLLLSRFRGFGRAQHKPLWGRFECGGFEDGHCESGDEVELELPRRQHLHHLGVLPTTRLTGMERVRMRACERVNVCRKEKVRVSRLVGWWEGGWVGASGQVGSVSGVVSELANGSVGTLTVAVVHSRLCKQIAHQL
jgi:hypothetical protein